MTARLPEDSRLCRSNGCGENWMIVLLDIQITTLNLRKALNRLQYPLEVMLLCGCACAGMRRTLSLRVASRQGCEFRSARSRQCGRWQM